MLLFANILIIALSGVFVTLAWVRSLGEEMVFERAGKWVSGPQRWKKPLGGCAYCTSFWVTALMFVLYQYCVLVWLVLTTLTCAMFIVDLLTYNDLIE